ATIERGRAYVRDYYSFAGDETADYIANSALLGGAEQIKWYAQAMADIGADEVVFWPGTTDVDQVKLLADTVA
ncbi:MAG: LLM class flavin-dependent oxidoreductase, partial [Dehalococcoidia bacterium]